ncbi:MAG: type II toxin-antitoxin system RelE/ParE family toxin [Caulobacteraceae bacterium]|nr:type II toxin-antitoxin system RelE/ParE family toxin [Caulobacteraceae bacterium]
MRLRWSRRAVRDLGALQLYIAQDSQAAARRQTALILAATHGLPRFPASGRPGRLTGTRELVVPRTPFVIPYRVRGEIIEILGVLHGRRRWPKRL